MQFASKCAVFQIQLDKTHSYFCLPFPLMRIRCIKHYSILPLKGNVVLKYPRNLEIFFSSGLLIYSQGYKLCWYLLFFQCRQIQYYNITNVIFGNFACRNTFFRSSMGYELILIDHKRRKLYRKMMKKTIFKIIGKFSENVFFKTLVT